jgi:ubiquinone biosynthesis protein UbiJ
MEASRVNWNDDRLDRLADEVGAVRAQVDALDRHMNERFEKQEAKITDRFDRLQNSLIITLAGILAAFTSVVIPTVF